jgi:hypothetical protein
MIRKPLPSSMCPGEMIWLAAGIYENGECVMRDQPGLGLDLDVDVIAQHPYVPNAFPSLWDKTWLAVSLGRGKTGRAR